MSTMLKKRVSLGLAFMLLFVLFLQPVGAVGAQPIAQAGVVTYVTNGGFAVAATSATTQAVAAAPFTTRTGYVFEGWYLDEALETAAVFPYTVVENVTMYAKWSEGTEPAITTLLAQLAETGFATFGSWAVTEMGENLYHIDDSVTSSNASSIYVLVDENEALVVEGGNPYSSGSTAANLRLVLDALTGPTKPLKMIQIHGHGDHVGITSNRTIDAARLTDLYVHAREYVNESQNGVRLVSSFAAYADKVRTITDAEIEAGYSFTVGSHKLDVYNLNGHTKGHLAVVDAANEFVLTSDGMGSSFVWMLFNDVDDTLRMYENGLANLYNVVKDMENPVFCAGHRWQQFAFENSYGEIDIAYVQEMQAILDAVKNGTVHIEPYTARSPVGDIVLTLDGVPGPKAAIDTTEILYNQYLERYVTEVSLIGGETLYKDGLVKLDAVLSGPDFLAGYTPRVEWSSSNEAVATVNAQGVVTALQSGEAVITAKIVSNITRYPSANNPTVVGTIDGASAECVVTVTDETTVFVEPGSIVSELAAYVNVTYKGIITEYQSAVAYMTDANGVQCSDKFAVTNEKARIYVPQAPEAGMGKIVVEVNGATRAAGDIQVVAYDRSIWVVQPTFSGDFFALSFGADIAARDGKFDKEITKNGVIVPCTKDGNNLVTTLTINDLATGENKFIVSGVKYPALFPSYSFTFTVNYTK